MSSKTTSQRRKSRLVLAEARAKDLRAILDRIVAIFDIDIPEEYRTDPEERIIQLASNAIAQDDQRLAPEKIRAAVREVEAVLRETKDSDE